MNTLKYLWQKHRLLLVGFSLATLLTMAFLMKFVFSVVYFANNRDVTIEPWTPIGYIARSYDVDSDWLAEKAGLPDAYFRPRESIKDAAKDADISFEEMRARVLLAIQEQRGE